MATKRKVQKPAAEGSVPSSVAKVAVKKVTEERNATKPKRPTVKELQTQIECLTDIIETKDGIIKSINEVNKDLQSQIDAYSLNINALEDVIAVSRKEIDNLLQELHKENPPSPKGWLAKLLEKMGA